MHIIAQWPMYMILSLQLSFSDMTVDLHSSDL